MSDPSGIVLREIRPLWTVRLCGADDQDGFEKSPRVVLERQCCLDTLPKDGDAASVGLTEDLA